MRSMGSSGGEATETSRLLGSGHKRVGNRWWWRCDVAVVACFLACLVLFEIFTMIVPFVYESQPPNPDWVNPVGDYKLPISAENDVRTPQQVLVSIGRPPPNGSIVVSWVTFDTITPGDLSTVAVYQLPPDSPVDLLQLPQGGSYAFDDDQAAAVVSVDMFTSAPVYFTDQLECPTVTRVMHAVEVPLLTAAGKLRSPVFRYSVTLRPAVSSGAKESSGASSSSSSSSRFTAAPSSTLPSARPIRYFTLKWYTGNERFAYERARARAAANDTLNGAASSKDNRTDDKSRPRRAPPAPSDDIYLVKTQQVKAEVAAEAEAAAGNLSNATGEAGAEQAPASDKQTPDATLLQPLTAALFGNMGTFSYHAEPRATCNQLLRQWAKAGDVDLFVHIGGMAHNLDDDCGRVGDAFMLDIEPFASRVPYMVGPGDHEMQKWELGSYNHYIHRYHGQKAASAAAKARSVRYYSFTAGLAHFVVLDADAWVHTINFGGAGEQSQWLIRDLARIDRSVTPWIVVMIHRAMYCGSRDPKECGVEARCIRSGCHGWAAPVGVEETLLTFGVDIVVAGHTRHYERSYPVARGAVTSQHYHNPTAPVHIQSGIAGGGNASFSEVPESFEAYRDLTMTPSVTRAVFHNSSHATLSQVTFEGRVTDEIVLVQHHHGEGHW
ncbi:Purple acid phosphatase 23 [Diplonema papillatum]|nr:Purple acid phosphatase 23 [Diplonema papillatum]|eukprot:gene6887-10565_t